MSDTQRKYNIGTYEIHPTTKQDLLYAIENNFGIARIIAGDNDWNKVIVSSTLEELRDKVTGLVRYFIDHQGK